LISYDKIGWGEEGYGGDMDGDGDGGEHVLGSISCMEDSVRKDMICSTSHELYASRAAMAAFRRGETGFVVVSEDREPILKVGRYV
jgi:hypothetical protein